MLESPKNLVLESEVPPHHGFAKHKCCGWHMWHLCFCTDPRFHKATAVPYFPPCDCQAVFCFEGSKPKGYRIDSNQGFLQTCCSCSTGHCAPSGSARLKYLQIMQTGPIQMAKWQCHLFHKPEETQGASLRIRARKSLLFQGMLGHLMGINKACLLIHLSTNVTKICGIYLLYTFKK